jgi:hypothetical protein
MARIQQVAALITAAAATIGVPGTITPWLKHDYYETPFDLSLLISQDTSGVNTLVIDYVLDDSSSAMQHQALISQANIVITVQDSGPPLPISQGGGLGHGLAIGDFVQISGSPGGTIDGVYSVATVTSTTSYTLTSSVSQTLAAFLGNVQTGKVITAGAVGDKIVGANGAGVVVRTSLSITSPIVASRLRCTAFSANAVARYVAVQGGVSS